jgi:hypothetical protein
MLIVLASLGLIRHHCPLDVATSKNRCVLTAPPSSAATPLPSSNAEGAPPFQCFLIVVCWCRLIVLASLRLIQRHRPIYTENSANTSTGTVQFQYWASTGAHTGIGTATMEFISSTGTLPSARTSIGIAAMEFQCRDGVHFQYGHLASACTSIGMAIRCPN